MKKSINPSLIPSISPLDNRYAEDLIEVTSIFCEQNLIIKKIKIEIKWLLTLASLSKKMEGIKSLDKKSISYLNNILSNFNTKDLCSIKKLEKKTNHDVKAIEYFLKEKLKSNKILASFREYIHFGLTSDDVNNLSYSLIIKQSRNTIIVPIIKKIILALDKIANKFADTPMLSRTHGQPATPTTFGKEIANFSYRLNRQFNYLRTAPILGKLNGTVGNFASLVAVYPKINWLKISQKFVENLDITWNPCTTQIEPHDWISENCDIISRINTILIGFCRDLWRYISIDYLKQKKNSNETGSSTMPHKINPINFENAEGNLGIANALFCHFSSKLPISRWQRDLSDSTVMRNLGVAFGHSVLSYKYLLKGINKLTVNTMALKNDIDNHWEILAEPIQTMLRTINFNTPYEQLKAFTMGQKINKKKIHSFINKLNIPAKIKLQLLKLTPEKYIGLADKITKISG